VVCATFRVPAGYAVTRDTTSADVDGWDSLSHALFIIAVENEFAMELPIDKVYALANIGELVDLIETQHEN
jgi:acyl carrier protein